MTYSAEVVLDSVNEEGERITTMKVTFPRFILPQMLTHRMFSRNFSSNRAVPDRIRESMPIVIPEWRGRQKGMQGKTYKDPGNQCAYWWEVAEVQSLEIVDKLTTLGVHHSITNRLLEPFQWVTGIITATEWENFFTQRTADDAQPEMQIIAEKMMLAHWSSDPVERDAHMPLGHSYTASAVECARVSYGEHEPFTSADDIFRVYGILTLSDPPHLSPLEHPAVAMPGRKYANYQGWQSWRHYVVERTT